MIGKQGVSLLIGKQGIQVKETLNAANETVARGIYDATTLSAVDGDLATGNIKSGITIFGFAGSADVRDISDATAIAAEVITGETFYAVSGGIRTGTMPIVTLAAGSSAYPAGYHAGDGGGLPAIDADLVTANIKSGITIFNVAGHNDVRDISDADLTVAEAPTGKTFYAVSGGKKTGSGTKTLNPANDTVAAGYYAATTLHAVDADLAVGNIKSGVTIFGFLGTYAPTLVEDTTDSAATTRTASIGATRYLTNPGIGAGADLDLAAVTQTYASGSMAVAVGYTCSLAGTASKVKTRLYMDGVQVVESAYVTTGPVENIILVGTRALSGEVECKYSAHNYDTSTVTFAIVGNTNAGPVAAGIGAGSITY